jgi:hypothetical protein
MKISSLKPGQILYRVSKVKMGNTTRNTVQVFRVVIRDICPVSKSFWASVNGNPAQQYSKVPPNWRAKKPVLVRSLMGYQRRATAAEIKAATALEEHSEYILVKS